MPDEARDNPFQAPATREYERPPENLTPSGPRLSRWRATWLGALTGALSGATAAAALGALVSLYVSPGKAAEAVAFALLGAPLGLVCGLPGGALIAWRLRRRLALGRISTAQQLRGRAALLAGFVGLASGALAATFLVLMFTNSGLLESPTSAGANVVVALVSLVLGAGGGAGGGWLLGGRLARELE